jgi:hypothetical protein
LAEGCAKLTQPSDSTEANGRLRDQVRGGLAVETRPEDVLQLGGLAEWPMATVLKTVSAVTPCSGVRIPRPPLEQQSQPLTGADAGPGRLLYCCCGSHWCSSEASESQSLCRIRVGARQGPRTDRRARAQRDERTTRRAVHEAKARWRAGTGAPTGPVSLSRVCGCSSTGAGNRKPQVPNSIFSTLYPPESARTDGSHPELPRRPNRPSPARRPTTRTDQLPPK